MEMPESGRSATTAAGRARRLLGPDYSTRPLDAIILEAGYNDKARGKDGQDQRPGRTNAGLAPAATANAMLWIEIPA